VRDVLVLCYHAVSTRWPAHLSVAPDVFEAQIRHLLRRGYRGTTFTRAVTGGEGGRQLVVTFDDGFQSVRDLAFPILRELGVPATLYVPTGFMDGGQLLAWPGTDEWVGGEHEHELAAMSWDGVRELREAGWEIGAHTHTHPKLTQVDDAQLADELERSRRICEERLGEPCRSVAYPYGDYDERVVAAAGAAGFETAATLPADAERPRALAWPRLGVYRYESLGRFQRHCSWTLRRAQLTPVWPVASAAWRRTRRTAA
jgi:peptidoglycan/xylan/chitin deacetylase (PgdA/CDA1 family)